MTICRVYKTISMIGNRLAAYTSVARCSKISSRTNELGSKKPFRSCCWQFAKQNAVLSAYGMDHAEMFGQKVAVLSPLPLD